MIRKKYLFYYLNTDKKMPVVDNLPSLENLKKEYIRYLLKLTDNDIDEIARILKISPQDLKRTLNKYNLSRQTPLFH